MSLGISTSCYYPQNTEEALKALGKAGVKTAEIFFNSNYERTHPFISELARIQKHYGMSVVSLHPSLSFAEPYYFFSEYERRFYEYREEFKLYYEAAAMLGSKYVILHGDRPCSKISAEEYCRRFMLLSEDARNQGVSLLQENVNNCRPADPDFISQMRRITGDSIGFCLDIKQSIRAGFTVDQLVEAMSGAIKHVHISDHTDKSDCLLPKNGEFDFEKFFKKMKAQGYRGNYIIEVYTNAYESPSEIIESYFNIIESCHLEIL